MRPATTPQVDGTTSISSWHLDIGVAKPAVWVAELQVAVNVSGPSERVAGFA